MSEEYPSSKRITRGSELNGILKKGRRVRTLDLDVRLLASPLSFVRVGIVVPRHGQSAVRRNLVKRRLRELSRKILLPVQVSMNVVIRCNPSVYGRTFEELRQQLAGVHHALVEGGNEERDR